MERRLFRSDGDRVLAGVCGGIAAYVDLDPVIVRLAWVLFTLFVGSGAVAYLVAWFLMPDERGTRSMLPLALLLVLLLFPACCFICSVPIRLLR